VLTAWAGKVSEVGERLTIGAMPVPVRLTAWVAGLALSVMVTVPVLVPVVAGLKVTFKVQQAPAATLEPQVLVWEKSPLTVMLARLRAALPVLLSVTL
jgi:H2-forming N5,N10-methylenetetrahydromethanopterin dehydrogenase-like enzyme